jgi:NADPH:quinone reductase-like Zn-dependent oxidoreductase
MRHWSFENGFGYDNLTLREGDTPRPGPRDVLLEMRAASLNYRDIVVLNGQHGRRVQPPLIPLSDGVGTVIETGRDVTDLHPGDRVAPAFFQNWEGGPPPGDLEAGRLGGPLDGVLATHRVLPARGVLPVPDHLTDAQAATLPCAGVTAWSAIIGDDPVRPGETVLILGSGGVALMALLLAKTAGVRTIVTTSSGDRVAKLRALGADHVVDRSVTPDWAAEVRLLTHGMGVDRVIELGGAATLPQAIKAARTGAQIILIGNVTGNTAELFLPAILTRQLTLRAVTVGPKAAFAALNRAVAAHTLRPVTGASWVFDDAPEAFRALEAGGHFGNLCIEIGPPG